MLKHGRARAGQWPLGTYLLIAGAFVALQAIVLYLMGQPPICACGTIRVWAVSGPENSQQLTDWYSYTHIIHGMVFYFLLGLVAPKLPIGLRFALAIGIEASWEMIENTPLIINRYRQSAIAQGYFGDSIVNSLADTLAAALGFVLARALPPWLTVALVIATELFLAIMIRDNLTLNIIQLIYPISAISHWQTGG